MEKIISWIFAAFLISNALSAQTNNQLRIDSVFVNNFVFLPDSTATQQTAEQVLEINSPELLFRAVSNIVNSDNVYWRVSFDYDNDGDFYETEAPFGESILYESGPIPQGSTPQRVLIINNLDSLPPNVIRTLRIELVDDPDDFGTSRSGIFNIFLYSGPGDRVTTAGKSSGGGRSGGDCNYLGVIENDVFRSYIYNWRYNSDVCPATIELKEAKIYTLTSAATPCAILDLTPLTGTDANIVSLELPNSSSATTNMPFQLQVGEKASFDLDLSTFTSCLPSNQIDRMVIKISYTDCNSNNTVERLDSICFGCRDSMHYTNRSSDPAPDVGKKEIQLPSLTYMNKAIIMSDSVVTLKNDTTELIVNEEGYILAGRGTWVEQGAYFWAHKEDTCPLDAITSINTVFENDVEEVELIKIAPNPTYDYFDINLKLRKKARINIVIYDLMGRQRQVVLDNKSQAKGEYDHTIDLSHLEAGLYYCQVIIDGTIYTRSVVKLE